MSLETPDQPTFTIPKITKQHMIVIGISLLALLPSIYFYMRYREAQKKIANPTQYANDEAKKLVDDVSSLMTLPEGETPTVATVNDKEKLKNQPFFAKSENGDKVLIYTNAKKAILYRPTLRKIIDVAPVNIGSSASASASTQQGEAKPMEEVTFTILNGTNVVGLTRKYETELLSKVKNAKILDKDNAKSKAYAKTLLIDATGKNTSQAQTLAKELGVEYSLLPEGEATPSGDYVVILGADKQ